MYSKHDPSDLLYFIYYRLFLQVFYFGKIEQAQETCFSTHAPILLLFK